MFGEEDSESPRLPSPWRNLSSSASSISPSPLSLSTPLSSTPGTPQDDERVPLTVKRSESIETLLSIGLQQDFERLSLSNGGIVVQSSTERNNVFDQVPTIGPEVDKQGHIEYKFKLSTPNTPHRLQRLVTQLKWRLVEGGGCAVYELGVLDSGALVGLNRIEMQESLKTLGSMLSQLGGGHVRIARVVLLGGRSSASELTDDSDSSSSSTSTTLSRGFKSFDVSPSTNDEHSYAGMSIPIPIKSATPPHFPERTPLERANIKRAKRDARRLKKQQQNDFLPPIRTRKPLNVVGNDEEEKKQRTYGHAAQSLSEIIDSDSTTPDLIPTKPQYIKKPKASVVVVQKIKESNNPNNESPHKPRPVTDQDEERFVIEAIVMKRPNVIVSGSHASRRSEDSSDEASTDLKDGSNSRSTSGLEDGSAGEEMFGAVDDEEEGWSYLAFDSLPQVRRSSGSNVVQAW